MQRGDREHVSPWKAWADRDMTAIGRARFVTFGVDPASLGETPSVADAVLTNTRRLSDIEGAKPVATELEAYTFGKEALPRVHQEIVTVLGMLVRDLSEASDVPH